MESRTPTRNNTSNNNDNTSLIPSISTTLSIIKLVTNTTLAALNAFEIWVQGENDPLTYHYQRDDNLRQLAYTLAALTEALKLGGYKKLANLLDPISLAVNSMYMYSYANLHINKFYGYENEPSYATEFEDLHRNLGMALEAIRVSVPALNIVTSAATGVSGFVMSFFGSSHAQQKQQQAQKNSDQENYTPIHTSTNGKRK